VALPDKSIKVQSYIGYDQQKAGRLCGEYIVHQLEKKYGRAKGKVIVLLGLPGFHTRERTAGFMKGLDLGKHPEIVVEKYPAKWTREEGRNVMERLLTKDKNIDAVFGCSDAMMQGAARAAMDAGVDITSIGIDGNPDTIEDIEKGVVDATLAVFPREMGRLTVRTIDKVLRGQQVPQLVESPMMVVTKDNLAQFKEQFTGH